jgi:hypothetical protein
VGTQTLSTSVLRPVLLERYSLTYYGTKEGNNMDEKQQKQINGAAKKFADALKQSYQSLTGRSVSVQELNAQLTQDFFNAVTNNLRSQA